MFGAPLKPQVDAWQCDYWPVAVFAGLQEFAVRRTQLVNVLVPITGAGNYLAFVHPFISVEVPSAAVGAFGLGHVRFRVPLQDTPGAAFPAAAVGFHLASAAFSAASNSLPRISTTFESETVVLK